MIIEGGIVLVMAATFSAMKKGSAVLPGEFPFSVTIWISSDQKLCGGVLITEWDVVTTCSCVASRHAQRTNLIAYEVSTVELYAGTVSPFDDPRAQKRRPGKSQYHPGCVLKTLNQANFDLGAYKMETQFIEGPLVQPYAINYNEREELDKEILKMIDDRVQCVTIGGTYNKLPDDVNSSYHPKGQLIKQLAVRLIDEDDCRKTLCRGTTSTCDIDIYTRGHVCAEQDEGTGPCKYDSGYALICRKQIVGVTSLSRPCANLQVMGTYMRLDVAYRFLYLFTTGKELGCARTLESNANFSVLVSFLLILLNR